MKVWIVASLCYFLSTVECYTSFDSVRTETTVFGTVVKYCRYNGMDILPGSIVRNKAKCEEASCTEESLTVTGFGINAGVYAVDKGCVVVADGCSPRVVSTTCPQPTPPLPIILGKALPVNFRKVEG